MIRTICFILFIGSFVEGFPVQTVLYKAVRCKPDDQSVTCVTEGSLYDIAQDTRVKRSEPSWYLVSGEESGSGPDVSSGSEPDVSSGSEPDVSSGSEPDVSSGSGPDFSSEIETSLDQGSHASDGDESGSELGYSSEYMFMPETDNQEDMISTKLSGEELIL